MLSDEWEYVHLTPAGWIDGSRHLDHGEHTRVETPADCVLTCYRRVEVGAVGAKPNITMQETEHTLDKALIASLIEQHGKPQFCV